MGSEFLGFQWFLEFFGSESLQVFLKKNIAEGGKTDVCVFIECSEKIWGSQDCIWCILETLNILVSLDSNILQSNV